MLVYSIPYLNLYWHILCCSCASTSSSTPNGVNKDHKTIATTRPWKLVAMIPVGYTCTMPTRGVYWIYTHSKMLIIPWAMPLSLGTHYLFYPVHTPGRHSITIVHSRWVDQWKNVNNLTALNATVTELALIDRSNDNIGSNKRRALSSLCKRTDIVIKRADKGSATVVMSKDDYLTRVMSHLNNM